MKYNLKIETRSAQYTYINIISLYLCSLIVFMKFTFAAVTLDPLDPRGQVGSLFKSFYHVPPSPKARNFSHGFP